MSLTYRVKSAHKVKLTDKQLLQWMFPILLVMLIFLGAWTLSMPPQAEVIHDSAGLAFKQCQYNWWDHSLSIGKSRHFRRPLLSLEGAVDKARFFYASGMLDAVPPMDRPGSSLSGIWRGQ